LMAGLADVLSPRSLTKHTDERVRFDRPQWGFVGARSFHKQMNIDVLLR